MMRDILANPGPILTCLVLWAVPLSAQISTCLPHEGYTMRATGVFEVRLTPLPLADTAGDKALGRMGISKEYHGDLEATARGEMLTAITPVQGSAGYVAIEQVAGTLERRHGTFVLQHSGTMTLGTPQLRISVVPNSGTGDLVGLAGDMCVTIADGRHSYELDYTLTDGP
jgi:Protein of unknown function (DUF3224)